VTGSPLSHLSKPSMNCMKETEVLGNGDTHDKL
jgi:hypothetical protein